MLRRGLALAALAWLGAAGCTPTVTGEARPALAELAAPLRRVAVMPLSVSPLLEAAPGQGAAASEDGARLVSRHLAEALAARGLEVIAPEDVAATLAGASGGVRPAQLLAEKHGADAVLVGTLTRWEERQGEAIGAMHAAAVGFKLALLAAPGGKRLWNVEFDERQQPLGDNVLRAGKYPGGGMRWLTAAELAHWGADEAVRALPLETPRR